MAVPSVATAMIAVDVAVAGMVTASAVTVETAMIVVNAKSVRRKASRPANPDRMGRSAVNARQLNHVETARRGRTANRATVTSHGQKASNRSRVNPSHRNQPSKAVRWSRPRKGKAVAAVAAAVVAVVIATVAEIVPRIRAMPMLTPTAM
jgi:hypothetical protein